MTPGVQRRLGTADAVVLGLAAMLGTGVFAVWGPAAAAAGHWLVLSVVLAGIVAAANAGSAADCAVAHPESGGGYVYGRVLLGPGYGRLGGVAFLIGKSSSAAAAAGIFGSYVLPSAALPAALLAIAVATGLNIAGVRWTAAGAWTMVGGTLAVLLLVVVIGLTSGGAVLDPAVPGAAPLGSGGPFGIFTAAGLVFFAFAGYARIATLGEEVRDPRRTVRRAVAIALAVAVVVYLLVAVALMVGMGSATLAEQVSPLATLVDSRGAPGLGVIVRVGAAVAAGSALLTVLVGVSRTTMAMARGGDLPAALRRIGPRGTPWRADLAGGVVAALLAVIAGPAAAIAVSACSVLVYYAVVNLAALRLPAVARSWPRWTSMLGLTLCVLLAVLLPHPQVLITAAALVVGWTACTLLPHRG